MNTHTLRLRTDEMIFTRSALAEQVDRYSLYWRKAFIEHGSFIANVYIPAIRSCQSVIQDIDKLLEQEVQ